ncbi:RJL family GTPase [Cladochytrium replicatum]|nr:RJL family GTPase [Cladochytrium replicatum]
MAESGGAAGSRQILRIKLLSMGDSGVGKSCLIKRYCEQRFISDYIPTIGIDYGVKAITIGDSEVKINFWDVAGDPIYYEIRNEFYRDTNGVLLVYDVCNRMSFENLDNWLSEMVMLGGGGDAVIYVAANKIDQGPRTVSMQEGLAWAQGNLYRYFETSASGGDGVNELFSQLFQQIVKKIEAKANPEPID